MNFAFIMCCLTKFNAFFVESPTINKQSQRVVRRIEIHSTMNFHFARQQLCVSFVSGFPVVESRRERREKKIQVSRRKAQSKHGRVNELPDLNYVCMFADDVNHAMTSNRQLSNQSEFVQLPFRKFQICYKIPRSLMHRLNSHIN